MKRKLITILSIALSLTAFSQKEIKVEDGPRPMSKGTFNSYSTFIPQTTFKRIEKDWKKYLGASSKGKLVENNGEMMMPALNNKNIGGSPLNAYSKLLETTEGVNLTAWLNYGDSVYISKELSADQDIAAKKYIRDFAIEEYQYAVTDEVDLEKDKQKKLEGELKDLIKQEEKSHKHINENERSIDRAKNDIRTNASDQAHKADEIAAQKISAEGTKSDPNAYKGAQKTLKDLENEKKKLEKQNEKMNKDIDDWNKEIREEERKIEASKQDQKVKIDQIEKQKAVVKGVEDKLKNIK